MTTKLTRTVIKPLFYMLPLLALVALATAGIKQSVALSMAPIALVGGWLVNTGVEVDGDKGIWRTYYSCLGLTVGRWNTLPAITGVTLKYMPGLHHSTPGTFSSLASWNNASTKSETIIVMLSIKGSQHGIILQNKPFAKLAECQEFAMFIASDLQVPVHIFLPPHMTTETA